MYHTNHEYYSQNYDRKEKETSSSTTSTTTTRTTEPGVFPLPLEDMERIAAEYRENIGPLNGGAARMIEQGLRETMCTADDMIYAIHETALAPRPSAAYLRAILRRWAHTGVDAPEERNSEGRWWQAQYARMCEARKEELPF